MALKKKIYLVCPGVVRHSGESFVPPNERASEEDCEAAWGEKLQEMNKNLQRTTKDFQPVTVMDIMKHACGTVSAMNQDTGKMVHAKLEVEYFDDDQQVLVSKDPAGNMVLTPVVVEEPKPEKVEDPPQNPPVEPPPAPEPAPEPGVVAPPVVAEPVVAPVVEPVTPPTEEPQH